MLFTPIMKYSAYLGKFYYSAETWFYHYLRTLVSDSRYNINFYGLILLFVYVFPKEEVVT